jgi:quercetin dioxygenase-like cupin family protein
MKWKKSLGGTVVVLSTVLATGVATATPPHGVAVLENRARGVAVGSGVITVTPGSGAYVGSYALEPNSTAGWRTQPGLSILAITEGTVRVVQAQGCTTREYRTGEVAILSAGRMLVSNAASSGPATFVGYFDKLDKGAARPLADGAETKAPDGCAGGDYRAASLGLTAVDGSRGTFRSIPMGGYDKAFEARRLIVPDGGDVLILKVTALPGTSTGWYRHSPGLAITTRGRIGIYQPTATGCAKAEESHAGDAVSHAHHDLHLSVVEGTEPYEATLIYWGMGNNKIPMPGIANFAEANDFTPGPPNGCTTF